VFQVHMPTFFSHTPRRTSGKEKESDVPWFTSPFQPPAAKRKREQSLHHTPRRCRVASPPLTALRFAGGRSGEEKRGKRKEKKGEKEGGAPEEENGRSWSPPSVSHFHSAPPEPPRAPPTRATKKRKKERKIHEVPPLNFVRLASQRPVWQKKEERGGPKATPLSV